MAEFTYPVKPIGVDYHCDVCKAGKMVYQKLSFSGPPENRQTAFEHKCSNEECGHVQDLPEKYPTVRFPMQGGW